ncbi:hypothetical protein HDU77_001323 [Chytriomyces hyalinus]|nr:hypothetical protein HDU77_001323 [Chytriomyces hyalinus]
MNIAAVFENASSTAVETALAAAAEPSPTASGLTSSVAAKASPAASEPAPAASEPAPAASEPAQAATEPAQAAAVATAPVAAVETAPAATVESVPVEMPLFMGTDSAGYVALLKKCWATYERGEAVIKFHDCQPVITKFHLLLAENVTLQAYADAGGSYSQAREQECQRGWQVLATMIGTSMHTIQNPTNLDKQRERGPFLRTVR